ncbi:MAG TPA: serine protease, partial [Candidatus Bathyarchaeia archaeon]
MALTCRPYSVEASLEKKDLALINKAVFEVVVLKQTKDSLTYERPLPLDLLPYVERTDKYRSLGTAFAIGPTEFVSAAHVLDLGTKKQEKDYYIRDVNGTVYAIDKILKYSDRRDFVVFSVKSHIAGDYLPINANPEMNEKVYAVGNALGEGIVIRDGLYTSNTPEDLNGEWKWLRFSAAASPGNSGGPLLDVNGSVIGIVLRKSPNENLNIALPIREVINAKAGVAIVHRKMKYFLDNMPMTKIDTLHREIPLPKAYQALNEELTNIVEQFAAKLLNQLLTENQDKIFPNGRESLSLLNNYYHENFPRMITKGDDGNWDARSTNTKDLDLEHNGVITIGRMGNSILMHVRKPDDIPLQMFYNDSKVFMDTLLKGLGITRQVGMDKVKITSLGKADQESNFIDTYKRKWLVKAWMIEYSNSVFVT